MTHLPRPIFFLLGVIAVYVLSGWALAVHLGASDRFSFLLYSGAVVTVSFMLFAFFLGWRFCVIAFTQRPKHPAKALWDDVRTRLFSRAHVVQALPLFIGFIVFMSAFTSLKTLIPLVEPYAWDAAFSALDRTLHFGVDPWRILQPLFGHPWSTSAINIVYNLWFPVMFAVLYWQLFDLRRPTLRMRFFWTFFVTWILNGTVLAMLFSSAGPCFYEHVVNGANPYTDQITHLSHLAASYPVWAVGTQQMLWTAYESSRAGLGSGISAMPSVHVAMVTLFALLAWQYGRAARIFFIAFALLIMVGSVHLAWHYAVDGYLGAFVTLVIWWAAGKFFQEDRA
jgi:hypothetical protein